MSGRFVSGGGGQVIHVERKRRRYRAAGLACGVLFVCAFVGMLFAPRTARIGILLFGLTPIVAAMVVLLVLSQPTRAESGQTDLSKPSPRGRIGLMFLAFVVLTFILDMIRHHSGS